LISEICGKAWISFAETKADLTESMPRLAKLSVTVGLGPEAAKMSHMRV